MDHLKRQGLSVSSPIHNPSHLVQPPHMDSGVVSEFRVKTCPKDVSLPDCDDISRFFFDIDIIPLVDNLAALPGSFASTSTRLSIASLDAGPMSLSKARRLSPLSYDSLQPGYLLCLTKSSRQSGRG